MKRDTPRYVIELAKGFRKDLTDAESVLWEQLRKCKIKGYKFRRQQPIGRYITDFYCEDLKLAIELDGNIHSKVNVKEYDRIRQIEIESRGIRVLRFRNEDVFERLDFVISEIEKVIQPSILLPPRLGRNER